MKTQKYIQAAEESLELLEIQDKVKANPFFETRQMAFIEKRLDSKSGVFNFQAILKPVLIVFLIGFNVTIVYSYLHNQHLYNDTRTIALIQLSDNYMRSNDYYLSIQK
jgi:hypothetical protein